MQLSHLFAAFLLLAGTLIVGGAGTLAMDAAYVDSKATYNETQTNASTNDELEVGLDVSSTLAYLIPLFGFAAVPLGIVGLLIAVGWKSITGQGGIAR